jgi:hypothetical protein
MTKTRVFLHSAVAVMVALGICGQPELKAQDAQSLKAGVVRVGEADATPDDGFDAAASMYQGTVVVGVQPPSYTPATWPCGGGGSDSACSSLQLGGLVIPFPLQVITSPADGGEIVWTFTTTSASGTADFKVTITQGSKTVFTYPATFAVSANGVYYGFVGGSIFGGAARGAATAKVTTTVGSKTISGKTTIHLK